MVFKVCLLLILLCLSGFFSGSETALFSLGHGRLKELGASKSSKRRLISRMMENPVRILATILLGNTFVNIAASSLGQNIFSSFIRGDTALVISTLVMTALILIFGEVTPKTIAVQRSENVASWVAEPLELFSTLMGPVRRLLRKTTELLLGLFGLGTISREEELGEMSRLEFFEEIMDAVESKINEMRPEYED